MDELCDMKVSSVAAPKSHLHLWTTSAFLPASFRLIEAWGFEYKSALVWVKDGMGMGNYWRVSHEFLLLGTRGGLGFASHNYMSWILTRRTRHSAKPRRVAAMLENVSPAPYLELFGRESRTGWTVVGDQVERTLL